MKTVIFAAIAAACVSAPAFAQDAAPVTGPRAGVTLGYDNAGDEDGFAYGVTAGYDLALAPRITGGVEVSLGDTTVGDSGVEISRDLAASLRLHEELEHALLVFAAVVGPLGLEIVRVLPQADVSAVWAARFGHTLSLVAR